MTWEPEENLQHADEVLRDYWNRKKTQQARKRT